MQERGVEKVNRLYRAKSICCYLPACQFQSSSFQRGFSIIYQLFFLPSLSVMGQKKVSPLSHSVFTVMQDRGKLLKCKSGNRQ